MLGQNFELEIPINSRHFTEENVTACSDAFHELHDARFGFRLSDHIEIVNFLVTGSPKLASSAFPKLPGPRPRPSR